MAQGEPLKKSLSSLCFCAFWANCCHFLFQRFSSYSIVLMIFGFGSYLCVHTCVHVPVCRCMCVGECGSQRTASGVIPQEPSIFLFLRQAWSLPTKLGYLAIEPKELPCPRLPSTGIKNTSHQPSFKKTNKTTRFRRITLESLCSGGKHFTNFIFFSAEFLSQLLEWMSLCSHKNHRCFFCFKVTSTGEAALVQGFHISLLRRT